MTSTALALVLTLPLLCIFNLQTAHSAHSAGPESEFLDPRDALRFVRNNDNCNKRKFVSMSASETKRKAHNACVYAYQNFWELREDERKTCIDPQDPACRWFYREERGFFKACSFVCRRESLGPMDSFCFISPYRNVPLADIIPATNPASVEIPIESSHQQPQPPTPQYRPPTRPHFDLPPPSQYNPPPPSQYRPPPQYNPPQPPPPQYNPPQQPPPPPPSPQYNPPQPPPPQYRPQPPPQYNPPPPPPAAGPRPSLPPARVQSDVDQQADLFIKQFHDRMERQRNLKRGWSMRG